MVALRGRGFEGDGRPDQPAMGPTPMTRPFELCTADCITAEARHLQHGTWE
jgi:hypothetical protein